MRCPSCGQLARVNRRGALGVHSTRGDVGRQVCPHSQRPPEWRDDNGSPPSRRTCVEVAVVVPAEWTDRHAQLRVERIVRQHIGEAFVIPQSAS